jgi:hypothetical protein
MFKNLGIRLWMWKMEMFCRSLERKNKKARRKYCRKGYHKIISQSITWKEGHKRSVTIRYLKCLHCNYYFFATVSQKELFLKKEGKAKDAFSALPVPVGLVLTL